jgi:hypothetical protein
MHCLKIVSSQSTVCIEAPNNQTFSDQKSGLSTQSIKLVHNLHKKLLLMLQKGGFFPQKIFKNDCSYGIAKISMMRGTEDPFSNPARV